MASSRKKLPVSLCRLWLGLAILTAGSLTLLSAQDQLTKATVSEWQITGQAPVFAPDQSTVTLPAGGQLVRSFPAGELLINVVSRPFFSAKADSRPILEVGPASLVLVRNDSGGGVVMVGDELLLLPSAIALGEDGRSVKPLDLSLYFDYLGNQAVLVLDGATYPFAAKAGSAQIEVAVSAGSEADWEIARLEIIAPPANPASSDTNAPAAGGNADSAAADLTRAQLAVAEVGLLEQTRHRRLAALKYASGDQDQAAAQELALIIRRKPDTAAWDMEMAQIQVQLAIEAAQNADTRTADHIARLALSQIAQCVERANASESDISANALELAGFVQERFLGDLVEAKLSYRQATEIWPEDETAKNALARLEAIDREAVFKAAAGGGAK